jgi:YVTN family beta-propeller protein
VNPATSQVYISDDIDNTVSVLDGTTNTVSAMVPLMVKSKPCGIAVNPVTNRVYVTNRSTNSVSVLDGNTFVTESEHAFAKLQSTMPHPSTDGTLPPFDERFTAEKLDLTRWVVTRNEACLGSSIDIINRNATERWLRLRMETPGAPKLKRKCQGVRTRDAVINFERRTEIQFVLDWNNPALAQGLEAGIMLCPDARSAAPAFGGVMDYIKVLYAGEHAGAKAFITISVCIEGEEHAIYDEGYRAYSDDVTGTVKFDYRTIGVQRIRIILNKDEIAVWENDKQLCQSTFKSNEGKVAQLPWDTGYLYLQQAYGEDLPVRDVFFSNISVRQLPEQAKPR